MDHISQAQRKMLLTRLWRIWSLTLNEMLCVFHRVDHSLKAVEASFLSEGPSLCEMQFLHIGWAANTVELYKGKLFAKSYMIRYMLWENRPTQPLGGWALLEGRIIIPLKIFPHLVLMEMGNSVWHGSPKSAWFQILWVGVEPASGHQPVVELTPRDKHTYGQFRITHSNFLSLDCGGKTGGPGEKPCKHGENMQITQDCPGEGGFKLRPSSCEVSLNHYATQQNATNSELVTCSGFLFDSV